MTRALAAGGCALFGVLMIGISALEQAAGTAPVAGAVVTQRFGCTSVAIEPVDAACPGGHFHSGIDLSAPQGTAVTSVGTGTATVIDDPGGFGLHILVADGAGLEILYAHLSKAAVVTGASVEPGSALGEVGSTGLSTGPHLHFEVDRDGRPIDPGAWLPARYGQSPQGGNS